MKKVLPVPGVLSTPKVPPMASTRPLERARPRPVPSTCVASAPRRSKGTNSRFSMSGEIPAPWSVTCTVAVVVKPPALPRMPQVPGWPSALYTP